MSKLYAEKIVEHHPKGPYFLAGWSSGGIVAVETAKQLVKSGKQVSKVFIIDKPIELAEGKQERAGNNVDDHLKNLLKEILYLSESEISQISQKNWKSDLFKVLKGKDVFNFKINEQGIERFLEVIKANILAELNYKPSSIYEGDVVIFKAAQRPGGEESSLLGWENCVKGEITLIETPGTHRNILNSPNAEYLASHMTRIMRGAIRINS